MLLHQMVDQAALRHPESPAARCDGETLTYEQLARRANGLARLLLETGVQRRGRVAVLLNKGLNVPVSFYGVMAAGASLVPIDPRSPAATVARIVRSTGATHLVSERGKRETVAKVVRECPTVAHVVGLEAEEDETLPCHPWTAVDELATDRQPEVAVIELDPSYILHTSGSTGIPKLIQHTHRSAMGFLDWAVSEYSLTRDDRLSNHSSHHTCFATFDYYAAGRAGATTIILTPAVMMMPGSLSSLMEKEGISVWYSVPTALVQLSLRGDLEARDLSALRWVLFAGETFPEKHLRRLMAQLPEARFSHVYGSTEVNVCAYFHLPTGSDLDFPLPIGKPCSNSVLEVAGSDLEPVASGEVGELLVRGSTVMSGYWGDAERNREVLIRRPAAGGLEEVYYRTGDRSRVRSDGNLAFVARSDLQVKVRGHRVELEEIEAALLSLAAVEEAAVFTVPESEGSSAIQAVVVAAKSAEWSRQEALSSLKELLPPYCLPASISQVDSLPRTPTGKVDRNALRDRLQEPGEMLR
ncbi:MAG: amino acid adenylation domain-containing protein [Thermoanaerobaculia bacterium]